VLVFGGLKRLEILSFGSVSHVLQGWGAMFPRHPRGHVELMIEGCQVWCPPRFGVVRRSGDGGVLLEKGGESIQ